MCTHCYDGVPFRLEPYLCCLTCFTGQETHRRQNLAKIPKRGSISGRFVLRTNFLLIIFCIPPLSISILHSNSNISRLENWCQQRRVVDKRSTFGILEDILYRYLFSHHFYICFTSLPYLFNISFIFVLADGKLLIFQGYVLQFCISHFTSTNMENAPLAESFWCIPKEKPFEIFTWHSSYHFQNRWKLLMFSKRGMLFFTWHNFVAFKTDKWWNITDFMNLLPTQSMLENRTNYSGKQDNQIRVTVIPAFQHF